MKYALSSCLCISLCFILCRTTGTATPVDGAEDHVSRNTHTITDHQETPARGRSQSQIVFTENRGQVVDTDGRLRPDILYTADAGTARLYFTTGGVSYVFHESAGESSDLVEQDASKISGPMRAAFPADAGFSTHRMDMQLVGSNPFVRIRAEEKLSSYSNYYYPHCPEGITHVPGYRRIVYENVYDHIDMVFAAAPGKTKYEFVVRAGGDPSQIRLRYDGAVAMEHAADGRLFIATPIGAIDEQSPYSYQVMGKDVPTTFVLSGKEVTFDVGAYDPTQTLVIDPWATYYGGTETDDAYGVAVDPSGDIIVCGYTYSTDFPVSGGPQGTHAGGYDIAILKFSNSGSPLWSTYYGGSANEMGHDIAVDASGNIAIVGPVGSIDFPVKNALQPAIAAKTADDAFVLMLSGSGACQWATYFGGTYREHGIGIALDGSGDVVITGFTESDDFPVKNAWQKDKKQQNDAFLSKFSSTGALLWSTYIGGERGDGGEGVTVDASGDIVLVGVTTSQYFPVQNALQPVIGNPSSNDAFIAKFSSAGVLDWCTYCGGSGGDGAYAVTTDNSRNVIVGGSTGSADFPVSGAEQPYIGGGSDAYILKMTPGGARILATFFGGSGGDGIGGVATDANDNMFFTGGTNSVNLPVVNPWQPKHASSSDAYVVKLDRHGKKQWATYLGGDRYDVGRSIDCDGSGNVILCGRTSSLDFPVYNAWQPDLVTIQSGDNFYGTDMFVASMSPDGIIMPLYKPATPTNLSVTALSPTKVMLSWTDNADNETEYIIEMRKEDGPWQVVATDTMNAFQHMLTGLQPQTRYTFRVKAVNWAFDSDYSPEKEIIMPVFPAPLNLKVADVSSKEVGLLWEDIATNETDYIVELKNGGDWRPVDTLRENSTTATVTNLTPLTTYSFRVFAMDSLIASDYSNVVQATTLKFLHAPTDLTASLLSETSVHLEWTDHSPDETGYDIEQRIKYGLWTVIHTADADVTHYDVTGLTEDTTYAFRVRAVGADAASAYSNEVFILTSLAPATPVNLVADALDIYTVQLSWERASTNENLFEIDRSEDGATWTSSVHTTTAGITELKDEHLEPNTVYWYRVRAVNEVANSGYSNVDTARTYARPAPGRPFFADAEALDGHTIKITWVLPPNSYEDGCEIQESPTRDDADFVTIEPAVAPGKRAYERKGLEPLTTYYYRVRAYNSSGTSPWSDVVYATTLEENLDLPPVPTNVYARPLSTSEIRITWEMPSPSNEDGFEIERSEIAHDAGFQTVTSNLGAGDSSYTDHGLRQNAKYWYRVRARNSDGCSDWSAVVSATTDRNPMGQELRDAMAMKEAMFSGLEELIPDGSASMVILRQIFADYQRGYDETAARSLIARWQTDYPEDQSKAVEAFERFAFLERVMSSGFQDLSYTPPIEGAAGTAKQAAAPIGMTMRNVCALGLTWEDECAFLGSEEPCLDAAIVDMINPVFDGAILLMQLMGITPDAKLADLYVTMLEERGEIPNMSKTILVPMVDYWKEYILGTHYLPVTQPLIPFFADKTEQLDCSGSRQAAIAKRSTAVQTVRTEVDALRMAFAPYGSICTAMDAAYALDQAAGTPLEAFFQKLRDLRPRMVTGLHDAIAAAATPVARMLYLTASEEIPELGSLPALLRQSGLAIFNPETSGFRDVLPGFSAASGRTGRKASPAALRRSVVAPSVASDRDSLIELRGKVQEGDTDFIIEHFEALRRSGHAMIAEAALLQRPLLGIEPMDIYLRQDLRDDYYGILARMQLLAMRRAVLSVSLMDYVLTPTTERQDNLLVEIDSILAPLDAAVDAITAMRTGTESLITLPALGVTEGEIVREPSSGEHRCSLRLTTANLGGSDAPGARAIVTILSRDVTAMTGNVFSLGALQPGSSGEGSMEIEVPPSTRHVEVSVVLETGNRRFLDRRTIAVPSPADTTTAVDTPGGLPASCILHQNYPNPFNPGTTISYTLTKPMRVALIVTDALGREVKRIASRWPLAAGTHAVAFDASGLPSGVYSYRLETPDVVLTRKMVLMR